MVIIHSPILKECVINSLNSSSVLLQEEGLLEEFESEKEDFDNHGTMSERILEKMTHLVIDITGLDKIRLEELMADLKCLLVILTLREFQIYSDNEYTVLTDMSFLEYLNSSIKRIGFKNLDLCNANQETFSRFSHLEEICFFKDCSIPVSAITSVAYRLNPNTHQWYEIAKYIKKGSKDEVISCSDLDDYFEIIQNKHCKLDRYLQLAKTYSFDSDEIEGITITVDDDFDFEGIDLEQLVQLLNSKTNLRLQVSAKNLQSIDPNCRLTVPTDVFIENVAELNVEELERREYVEAVYLYVFTRSDTKGKCYDMYTAENYKQIREEIGQIVPPSQIVIPEGNDPDKEKKIFAQIYGLLGETIEYNNFAITEEGEKDKKLQDTCRNLEGAILQKNACV